MSPGTEVRVDPCYAAHVDAGWVRELVCEVLVQEGGLASKPLTSWGTTGVRSGATGTGELTVVITDNETVWELNRRYRGVDSPTDVLAFGGTAEGFAEAPDATAYLGDVVISYPCVLAQAEEQGQTPDGELALLVVHGVLHLLGYDHANAQEEATMRAKEEAILKRVGH